MGTMSRRTGRERTAWRRAGFTLVELLVVISIIGMLMALLLPAVQQARELARSNTCRNNLKNVSLAVLNFESARRQYPGYRQPMEVTFPGASAPTDIPVGYIVVILPYLERTDVYNLWRSPQQCAAAGMGWPPQVKIEILTCPSSPPPSADTTPCTYVPNSGMLDAQPTTTASSSGPSDFKANGIFFNHRIEPVGSPPISPFFSIPINGPLVYTSQDYITASDGSSLTFMLSEQNDQPSTANAVKGLSGGPSSWGNPATAADEAFVWWPRMPPTPEMSINAAPSAPTSAMYYYYFLRPASSHPGGVNASFCDGHVKFISDSLDYNVYCLLMTPKGSACNTPGTTGGLDGNPGVPPAPMAWFYYASGSHNYPYLRHTPVDESLIK